QWIGSPCRPERDAQIVENVPAQRLVGQVPAKIQRVDVIEQPSRGNVTPNDRLLSYPYKQRAVIVLKPLLPALQGCLIVCDLHACGAIAGETLWKRVVLTDVSGIHVCGVVRKEPGTGVELEPLDRGLPRRINQPPLLEERDFRIAGLGEVVR